MASLSWLKGLGGPEPQSKCQNSDLPLHHGLRLAPNRPGSSLWSFPPACPAQCRTWRGHCTRKYIPSDKALRLAVRGMTTAPQPHRHRRYAEFAGIDFVWVGSKRSSRSAGLCSDDPPTSAPTTAEYVWHHVEPDPIEVLQVRGNKHDFPWLTHIHPQSVPAPKTIPI